MSENAPLPPGFWDEDELPQRPERGGPSRVRKIFGALFLLFLLLVALHTIVDQYLLHRWEALKAEHAAVKAVVTEVSPPQNALPVYLEAADLLEQAAAGLSPSPADALEPLLAGAFKGELPGLPSGNLRILGEWNTKSSDVWEKLVSLSGERLALSLSSDQIAADRIPAIPALQTVHRFLLARAWLAAQEDRPGDACDALLLSGQISLQLARGPLMIDGMMGRALAGNTYALSRVLLQTRTLPDTCRDTLLQLSRAMRDSSQILNQMRTERDFLLDLPAQPETGLAARMLRPYVMLVLLRTMEEWDKGLAVLRIPDPAERERAMEETARTARARATLAPNLFKNYRVFEFNSIPFEMFEICLQQVRHKEAHGQYAGSLEALRTLPDGLAADIEIEEFHFQPVDNGFELRSRPEDKRNEHVIIWRD